MRKAELGCADSPAREERVRRERDEYFNWRREDARWRQERDRDLRRRWRMARRRMFLWRCFHRGVFREYVEQLLAANRLERRWMRLVPLVRWEEEPGEEGAEEEGEGEEEDA